MLSEREIGKREQPESDRDPLSDPTERKRKHLEVHVAGTTSSSTSSSSLSFHLLRPRSRTSKRHGLLTAERGRAGPDVEDFGEEAGSVFQLNRFTLDLLTVKRT